MNKKNLRKIKFLAILLVGVPICLYLLVCAMLFFQQTSYLYHPNDQDFTQCSGFDDAEKVEFQGTRMYHVKDKAETIVVYYHPNTGSACDVSWLRSSFEQGNHSALYVEYTGYSNDKKDPKKKFILQDVKNVDQYIARQNYTTVIVGGSSLGSTLASYQSSLTKPDKLFLISPFTSIRDIAEIRFSKLPLSILLTEDYNTSEYLKNYDGELLIIHGSNDVSTPLYLSQRLFEQVPSEEKIFVEIEGAAHGDIFEFNKSFDTIEEFVK